MALRKVYFGTHGPYYYDDADLIDDPDLPPDFAGETRYAISTDGQILAQGTPTENEEVVRLEDLGGVVFVIAESRIASALLTALNARRDLEALRANLNILIDSRIGVATSAASNIRRELKVLEDSSILKVQVFS